MKLKKPLTSRLTTALMAVAASLILPAGLRAADHGDAPALAQDQGADIADVFLFMDPDNNANDKVILIATFHGFITPGEAVNFGVFDPTIKYRFEIFNDHVNRDPSVVLAALNQPGKLTTAAKNAYLATIKANRTIDVTFSARASDPNQPAATGEEALRGPGAQTATITLGGFPGVKTKVFPGKPTVTASLGATANVQTTGISTLATGAEAGDIRFFAGIVDDPFFFDIPAFSALIKARRETGSFATGLSALNRGRDTFAGYNCLAIALEIPLALVKGANGNLVGADFVTQRPMTVMNSSLGQRKLSSVFKTVDRMGNPGINVALIPFDKKNDYNGRTAKIDASLSKAGDILSVLGALGVDTNTSNPTQQFVTLASIAVLKGDILILDTSVANTGTEGGSNSQTGFGTAGGGRRLKDDVIDTVLTVLAGQTLGDNVAPGQDGKLPTSSFPFLATPNQPQQTTATLDDGTRN